MFNGFFSRFSWKHQEKAQKEPVMNGIVLSGGFWHGALQAGSLLKISELGIPIHYVSGSSVGAINGAAIASGKVKESVEAWRNVTQKDVFRFDAKKFVIKTLQNLRSGAIGPDGIVDGSPLEDLLDRYGKPKDLISSPTKLDVIVTNLQKREKEVFSNRDARAIRDPSLLKKAIRASSSIPIFFEPVVIGKYQYLDGGLVDNAPLSHAIKAGCDFIFFIDVSSSEHQDTDKLGALVKKQPQQHLHGLYSIGLAVAETLTRTSLEYDIQQAHRVNADIENLDAFRSWLIGECPFISKKQSKLEKYMKHFSFSQRKRVRIITIKPEKPLPAISLRDEVDPKSIEDMIYYGYSLTEKILKKEKII